MRGALRPVSVRGLLLLIAVVIVLIAIDGGSVFLTKISPPTTSRAPATRRLRWRRRCRPTSRRRSSLCTWPSGMPRATASPVKDTSFVIYPGGRVTLTGTKTAPTVLFHHFSWLASLARVSTTVTVDPLPYDS